MPRIPTIPPEGGAVPLEYPRVPAAPERVNIGQGLANLGVVAGDIAEKLDKQDAELELIDMVGKYDANVALTKDKVFRDPSIENKVVGFTQRVQKVQGEFLQGIKRSDVRGAFQAHISKTFPKQVVDVHIDSLKWKGQEILAKLDRIGEEQAKKAAESVTPEDMDDAMNVYHDALRSAEGVQLNPEERQEKAKKVNKMVLEKNMDYMRRTDRPEMFRLDREGFYSSVDPIVRLEILKAANEDIKKE